MAWFGLGMLAALPAAAETIQLERSGGVYMVPVRINDAVMVPFVIDSGAAELSIPLGIFDALRRTGTVSQNDFVGTGRYILADGSTISSERFILHKVDVGGHVIANVVANVAPVKGDPLLGQSFLARLPSWSIDNARHTLVLNDEGGPTPAPPILPRGTIAGLSTFGAFAYDGGAYKYGYSWNQDSALSADAAAIRGCATEKCAVVFRVGPRECGAIAVTTDGKAWGGARRDHRGAAELAAMQNCQSRTTGFAHPKCNR
jgi:hypothetical protein